MVIFKINLFYLSDYDQGIHKHAIRKKIETQCFWKKNITINGKKSTFCVSRTTLCSQKKIRLRLKKKILGQFQNYLEKSVVPKA